ncbi:MAG: response regulator [Candidatus Omnitrophica bacterium]|nr:response regulator [Candidatus Omnitrophota bacterium]
MSKQILLIDDDALVLKTISGLLSRKNYEVICAKDGAAARKFVREKDLNLIICDIRMPNEDGIALMKAIKEIMQKELQKEIPFMFITGYAHEEAPIDAIKLGVKDYLLKPFDMEEVLASVEKNIS